MSELGAIVRKRDSHRSKRKNDYACRIEKTRLDAMGDLSENRARKYKRERSYAHSHAAQ